MEERQVFISFESPEYKSNKASLLSCKIEIVQLQKRLITLHALRSNKKRLLANLDHLISSANFTIEKLDERMPDPTMPKHIKNKISKKEEHIKKKLVAPTILKEKIVEEEVGLSNLDRELIELNRRIKELG